MPASSVASDDSTDDLVIPHEVSPTIGRPVRAQSTVPSEFQLADATGQPPRPSSRKRAEPPTSTSGASGKRRSVRSSIALPMDTDEGASSSRAVEHIPPIYSSPASNILQPNGLPIGEPHFAGFMAAYYAMAAAPGVMKRVAAQQEKQAPPSYSEARTNHPTVAPTPSPFYGNTSTPGTAYSSGAPIAASSSSPQVSPYAGQLLPSTHRRGSLYLFDESALLPFFESPVVAGMTGARAELLGRREMALLIVSRCYWPQIAVCQAQISPVQLYQIWRGILIDRLFLIASHESLAPNLRCLQERRVLAMLQYLIELQHSLED